MLSSSAPAWNYPLVPVGVDTNGEAWQESGTNLVPFFPWQSTNNPDFSNAVNKVAVTSIGAGLNATVVTNGPNSFTISASGGAGGQVYGAGNYIQTNGFNISFTGTNSYVGTNTWFNLTNTATDFTLAHYQLSGALGTAAYQAASFFALQTVWNTFTNGANPLTLSSYATSSALGSYFLNSQWLAFTNGAGPLVLSSYVTTTTYNSGWAAYSTNWLGWIVTNGGAWNANSMTASNVVITMPTNFPSTLPVCYAGQATPVISNKIVWYFTINASGVTNGYNTSIQVQQ